MVCSGYAPVISASLPQAYFLLKIGLRSPVSRDEPFVLLEHEALKVLQKMGPPDLLSLSISTQGLI